VKAKIFGDRGAQQETFINDNVWKQRPPPDNRKITGVKSPITIIEVNASLPPTAQICSKQQT
jgi:hypothetical protein